MNEELLWGLIRDSERAAQLLHLDKPITARELVLSIVDRLWDAMLARKSLAPVVGAEGGEQARNDHPLPVATAEPGPGGTDDDPGRASMEETP